MSETNNTIKSNKNQYHHLTKDDRVKIQSLIEQVDEEGKRIFNNSYIADYIGVHKSTISRELKRIKSKINVKTGKIKNKPYNVEDAQNDYEFKRAMSKANYLLDDFPKLKKYIEDKILIDKWSPDAISGYINSHELYKQDGFTSISTTISSYSLWALKG